MNYEPNSTTWQHGDFVLHDADRKSWHMVMVVKRVLKDGRVWTQYRFPRSLRDDFRCPMPGHKTFKNPPEVLHDPQRFGVDLDDVRRRYAANYYTGKLEAT